jgi:hypothetical protein
MVSSSSPTPQGSPRQVAVIGTLMPHLRAGRHHVYRDVVALALLAALIAAGLGSLPVALVLAAVALPSAVLVYIHDHRLWHDEPLTVIVVTFGLSLLLGVGVGVLETHLLQFVVLASTSYHVPPVSRIVQVGLLVPVVAFVAVVIAPLIVSARAAFRHPMDVVVACSLSGAALSLGLSVVVEHGAFAHVQATAGDPAHVAFIALTLGFLQPIVLATAAMVGVLGLRGLGVNPLVGVVEGLALLVAYELATTLLQPDGTRGIVLTALAAFVLAGAGLLAARNGLHAAMAADTATGADAAAEVGAVEHRLHGGVVAAIVAVIVLVAAVISAAVVFGGPSTKPKPPRAGHGGILRVVAAAGIHRPSVGQSGQSRLGSVSLASNTTSLAAGTTTTAINLYKSVSITPASGWSIINQDDGFVILGNSDHSVGVSALAGPVDEPDISQESSALINATIRGAGMTNVQQDSSGEVKTIQGNNFQQMITVTYTGNMQTNQGASEIEGLWVTFYNPLTQTSGFCNVYSPRGESALEAATNDVISMLQSME